MTESAERELPELESQKKLAVQARNFDEAQRVCEALKTLSAAKETNVAKKEALQAEIATKEPANAETISQTFATEKASLEAQLADEVKRSEAAAAAATEAEAALRRELEVNLYCFVAHS